MHKKNVKKMMDCKKCIVVFVNQLVLYSLNFNLDKDLCFLCILT